MPARSREAGSDPGVLAALCPGLAHEVTNLISGIDSAVQVIGDHFPVEAFEQSICDEIQQRLRRLHSIFEDIVTFALPVTPVTAPLELADLLRDVALTLHQEAQYEQVVFELTDTTIPVQGDAELTKTLFANLFVNAAEAMEGAGTIRVTSRNDGARCRIVVADGGPGVPPELRERIFDPFFTTKSSGTGLGLAIARRAAEAQRGTISCAQSPTGGAELTVFLPLTSPELPR